MIVTNRSKRNKRTGQTSPNKATHRIKPARNKKSKRKISKKLIKMFYRNRKRGIKLLRKLTLIQAVLRAVKTNCKDRTW